MTELVPASVSQLIADLAHGGLITTIGLKLSDYDTSQERIESLCTFVGATHNASSWWGGDIILAAEMLYPEEASQLTEALGASPSTRSRWARTSERVPMSRRREELTWSHHFVVSLLEPGDQVMWLQRAIDEGLSKHQLEALIKPSKDPEDKHATCPQCGLEFTI